jgi:hypothetical protein
MSQYKKSKSGRFLGIPMTVAKSSYFAQLKAQEVKLLIDLLTQYNGFNNGSLSPCITLMKERGWAKSSLYRAFNGLLDKGVNLHGKLTRVLHLILTRLRGQIMA